MRRGKGSHGGVQRGLARDGAPAQAFPCGAFHKRPQLLYCQAKALQRKGDAARINPRLLVCPALQGAQEHVAVLRGKHGGHAAEAPGLKQAFFLIQRAVYPGH